MIEEQGQVLGWHQGIARVRVDRSTACGSCQARAACGKGLSQMAGRRSHEVDARCEQPVQVGDTVVLGVEESLLVQGALLVYLLPLAALLAGALLGAWLQNGEGWSIALGFAGFALAAVFLRLRNRKLAAQSCLLPQVLRVTGQAVPGEAVRWLP